MSRPDLRVATRDDLDAAAVLLRRAFPGAKKFSRAFLDWQYYANPVGAPLVCNLFEHGRLVGHLAGIPVEVMLFGAPVVVTLIMNIGLAPEARGGGRFRGLVEQVVAMSAERGHAGVVGVANAQSMDAFVQRLGFQGVASLAAWLEFAPHALDATAALDGAQFARRWRDETLAWRMRNPANPLRVVAAGAEGLRVEGRSTVPGLAARAIVPRGALTTPPRQPARGGPAVVLGLAPTGTVTRRLARDIPARLRPSPLRLIWRDHHAPARPLDASRVLFSFLDFDAF